MMRSSSKKSCRPSSLWNLFNMSSDIQWDCNRSRLISVIGLSRLRTKMLGGGKLLDLGPRGLRICVDMCVDPDLSNFARKQP